MWRFAAVSILLLISSGPVEAARLKKSTLKEAHANAPDEDGDVFEDAPEYAADKDGDVFEDAPEHAADEDGDVSEDAPEHAADEDGDVFEGAPEAGSFECPVECLECCQKPFYYTSKLFARQSKTQFKCIMSKESIGTFQIADRTCDKAQIRNSDPHLGKATCEMTEAERSEEHTSELQSPI